jgi:uncharacterized membrane protein (UPF0127 family)
MSKKNKSVKRVKQIISGVIVFSFILFLVFSNYSGTKQTEKTNIKQTDIQFKKEGELTFQKADGSYIAQIDIEIADTDAKRTEGLMYRRHMDENQGMLFLFPYESVQSFWMKNTVIPLDMIFVNKRGVIVTIRKNAVPFDEGQYRSTAPASMVVEVNGGYTDAYGINVGDKIVWRRR